MKPIQLKVARIGNSRGVRIPAPTLERYRIGDSVVMEETAEGILLRPRRIASGKLSWEETADAMAEASEDWTEWESMVAEGLEQLPWEAERPSRVAEPRKPFKTAATTGKRGTK